MTREGLREEAARRRRVEDDLNSLRLLNMLKTKDDISALKSRVDYNEYEATNRNMEG